MQSFDRQRILGATVNIAFAGAHGVTADDHSFQDPVGIAFQHAAVHKRAGIAFIGVTNDIFLIGLVFAGKFPFQTGRETAATPSTQSGSFDFVDNRFRSHLCQTFG